MLEELYLRNYRGFAEHRMALRAFTIAVGRNNAGKSTVVEALRLVAIVTERYRNLSYMPPPEWANLPRRYYGVSPSLKGTEINFATLYHRYGDPPAVVEARFSGGEGIAIYLGGNEEIYAVITNSEGEIVRSKAVASITRLPLVSAMPQLSPLSIEEAPLTEDYVRSALSSPLASRHFRNQIYSLGQLFEEFQAMAEDNWHGLQVRSLEREGQGQDARLFLHVRNLDFVGEVGLMGHGLQMWLQVIWFLTRSRGAHTVILDEPDVYMHPDLQRRLVRYLRTRFQQIVLTTHSVEIMSEVNPEQILIIDRLHEESTFADNLDAVQSVLSGLGSAQNIHLTRLWGAKRFLLLEGKDVQILNKIHNILFPGSESFQLIPTMQIGGWAGWPYAIGSSMAFKNAMGQNVTTYCVLDSDFHTPEELEERREEAARRGVQLHIWSRKEIENYLVIPSAIARVIGGRSGEMGAPSEEKILSKAIELSDSREEEILDNLGNEFFLRDRGAGHQAANRKARQRLRITRERDGNLLRLVSGKALLSDLSSWSSREYGVSFSFRGILASLKREEIPEEMGKVVTAIENGWSFDENGVQS